MKYVDCSTTYLPVICRKLGYYPTRLAQCISCVEEGRLVAGVVYDNFNEVSINAHIWIADGKVPSREWYAAIYDYPFNRLGIEKLVGQVAGSNLAAQALDQHFGFVEEARIKNYSPEGDLIFYTMTREQCRVLNSPRWTRIVELVGAA